MKDNNNINIGETNNRERKVVSDVDNSDSQTHDNEKKIERLDDDSTLDKNIYDQNQWKNIDTNLRYLFVKRVLLKSMI